MIVSPDARCSSQKFPSHNSCRMVEVVWSWLLLSLKWLLRLRWSLMLLWWLFFEVLKYFRQWWYKFYFSNLFNLWKIPGQSTSLLNLISIKPGFFFLEIFECLQGLGLGISFFKSLSTRLNSQLIFLVNVGQTGFEQSAGSLVLVGSLCPRYLKNKEWTLNIQWLSTKQHFKKSTVLFNLHKNSSPAPYNFD